MAPCHFQFIYGKPYALHDPTVKDNSETTGHNHGYTAPVPPAHIQCPLLVRDNFNFSNDFIDSAHILSNSDCNARCLSAASLMHQNEKLVSHNSSAAANNEYDELESTLLRNLELTQPHGVAFVDSDEVSVRSWSSSPHDGNFPPPPAEAQFDIKDFSFDQSTSLFFSDKRFRNRTNQKFLVSACFPDNQQLHSSHQYDEVTQSLSTPCNEWQSSLKNEYLTTAQLTPILPPPPLWKDDGDHSLHNETGVLLDGNFLHLRQGLAQLPSQSMPSFCSVYSQQISTQFLHATPLASLCPYCFPEQEVPTLIPVVTPGHQTKSLSSSMTASQQNLTPQKRKSDASLSLSNNQNIDDHVADVDCDDTVNGSDIVVSCDEECQPCCRQKHCSVASQQEFVSPTDRDVLCGKGNKTLEHNMHFTKLCSEYALDYSKTKKRGLEGKKGIAIQIIKTVYLNQGRFLKSSEKGWEEISDEAAIKKVAHCIRDIMRNVKVIQNTDSCSSQKFSPDISQSGC